MQTPTINRSLSNSVLRRLHRWLPLAALLAGFQLPIQAAKVLYVQNLSQRDTVKLINILKAQGHDVTVWTTSVNGNVLSADTYASQGYQLLIVDEVITSGAVGSSFTNSPIPVINWEGYLFSDGRSLFNSGSGLTGNNYDAAAANAINAGAGADFGQITPETRINIVLPSHPLAAGLGAGLVDVFDSSVVSDPNIQTDGLGNGVISFAGARTLIPGATVVAQTPGFTSGYCIFGVDVGATNYDGVTTNKARWVELPWNTTSEGRILVEPSFFLFEAAVAWTLKANQPTKIRNLLPLPASLQPTNVVVTFSVDKTTAAGSAVTTGNIQLKLNGSNAISGAVITDGGTQWNVAYTNKVLLKDKTYTIIASATAADGGFSARQTQIDTFSTNNFTWEAEDFNFGGGNYFDYGAIVLCTNIGGSTPGCYFDRVGWTNIDKWETNFTATVSIPVTNEVYRFGAGVSREEFADTFLTADTLVRAQYAAAVIPDYEVRSITNNEWMNYTRSYPTGFFNIYARVASPGALTVQIDEVTGDRTTANQFATNKLGRFVKPAGTSGYEMVPLTDDSGSAPQTVRFTNSNPAASNVLKTLRATALSAGYTPNFFMLVPTTAPPNVPPTITLTSPTNGQVLSESALSNITGLASDSDGTITNVQISVAVMGAASLTVINSGVSAAYNYAWSPPKLGALAYYILSVTARDNSGVPVTTNITVKVVDPSLKVVTTAVGSGADAQLNEYNYTVATGVTNLDQSGNGAALNARLQSNATYPTGVHEVVSIRLDLTGYDNSQIKGAVLNFINTRANSAHALHYYAVKDGTLGLDNNGRTPGYTDNTWDEKKAGANTNELGVITNLLAYSTMPGLFYNADPNATYDTNNIVDLGAAAMASGSVGTVVSFNAGRLTTFLNTNADSLVTILVDTDTQSSGQKRFTSKEATALEAAPPNGVAAAPSGTTNWFAPWLSFTVGNPTLNFKQTGNSLQFSWLGAFKLQAQTNAINVGIIGTNSAVWKDYPGGGVSPVTVPINPANPTAFYRLIGLP